jgi:hypothetical protein
MLNYWALYSVVFMMGFVVVFDAFHRRKRLIRLFTTVNFLTTEEVDQLRAIWVACQDS